MSKNLVIVESPAKAKTIEGYLGADFVVKSSFGHVRDLPKGNNAIDIENGFKPTYEITADKKAVVADLKKLAKSAEEVWLATDDDREGEAISWHLMEALGLKTNVKRIVFREITKSAITSAIQNPRTIDFDLVNAQQARRVLDRLVGFELSPVLWGKVQKGLSAGRVQSVAVRIIVEREREIINHVAKSSFKVTALFDLPGGKILKAESPKNFDTEHDAGSFLQKCVAAVFDIKNLETKPVKKSPAAPFTTSTLQQEASRKLSFSVLQTMTVAQRLYEAGKISYMRTDSTNLSQEAIAKAKAEIEMQYGASYAQTRQYKTKNEGAQEAHEAIRPTDFGLVQASSDRNEQRLYDLIRKRALASQMADAQLERTTATIGISTTPELLVAQGEVIKFEGFLKLYLESTDAEEDEESAGMLPPLNIGQQLKLGQMTATERFTRPAARYTEASLVKKLEELGIGRPSTYAPTISTIVKRDYVVKEDRPGQERSYRELCLKAGAISSKTSKENFGTEKAKLFPTNTGIVVNDFLVKNFPEIVDFSFTAGMEKEFDEIAIGKVAWQNMIDDFYKPFHKSIVESKNAERNFETTQRDLGLHPFTGEAVMIRKGKFGFFAQIGEAQGDIKPKYASLKSDQLMETITMEQVLELFKLPRTLGDFEGNEITVAAGKFGPYVKHDGKFVSLDKTDDPMTVDLSRAIELINAKRNASTNNTILTFAENADVQVLKGVYGPYIKFEKKNVKIPKDLDPATLSYQKCVELAEATPEKKAGSFKRGAKKK
jgi:DNA topoisomerase I